MLSRYRGTILMSRISCVRWALTADGTIHNCEFLNNVLNPPCSLERELNSSAISFDPRQLARTAQWSTLRNLSLCTKYCGKRENADYQLLPHFLQRLHKSSPLGALKFGIVVRKELISSQCENFVTQVILKMQQS